MTRSGNRGGISRIEKHNRKENEWKERERKRKESIALLVDRERFLRLMIHC